MYRKLLGSMTLALSAGLLVSSLALAGGMQGTVTNIDAKGMATVRTSDGKEHQVKASEGLKAGAKVECETKNGTTECRPAKS